MNWLLLICPPTVGLGIQFKVPRRRLLKFIFLTRKQVFPHVDGNILEYIYEYTQQFFFTVFISPNTVASTHTKTSLHRTYSEQGYGTYYHIFLLEFLWGSAVVLINILRIFWSHAHCHATYYVYNFQASITNHLRYDVYQNVTFFSVILLVLQDIGAVRKLNKQFSIYVGLN